jgi:tRNA-modifying protein YgfZ
LKQDTSSSGSALRPSTGFGTGLSTALGTGGAGLIDRSYSGRILLTGADRRSYLQGLLTNDIEALAPGTGCYAAMLTAQGRMMTDMRVLELGDAILLDVPVEVVSSIRDHLDRFVFAEDVQVEDVTGARAEIGLYGPGAHEVLVKAGAEGDMPATLFQTTRVRIAGADAVLVRSDEAGVDGFDLVVNSSPGNDEETVTSSLIAAGAVRVSESDAEVVRIENGRPRFGRDMDADTIPLEAGLEDRAISRSKGCYVGQEVIVRVQDRGHGRVAKRLVGLTLDAGASVPPSGARIVSGEREIGRVTSAVLSPALGRPIALGYVHRDFVAEGTALSIDGAPAHVAPLPFRPHT